MTATLREYLDKTGVLSLWNQMKAFIVGKKYAGGTADGGTANKAASIPFGEVDSTSTATAFTATVEGITELRDGICCYLKNTVVASAAASTAPKCWTLNINSLGAKPVYVTNAAATYSTTQFAKDYKFLFTYDESLNSGDGGWYIGVLFNTNTTYGGLTVAEITAGTSTTSKLISPKNLRDNFYTEEEVDTLLNSKVDNYSLEMEIGVSGNSYSVESIAYNNTYVTTFSAIYDICVSGSTSIVIKGYIDDGTDTNYYFYYVGSNMSSSGDVYFISPQEEGYFTLHLYSEGGDALYSSIDYVEYAQGGGGGDVNVIEGITMNGSAITPDANKVVNLGTVLTEHQDISGKADKSALANYTPTSGFATVNGSSITGGGNVVIAATEQTITLDATPTANSSNGVTSGGVYNAIEAATVKDTTINVDSTNPITNNAIAILIGRITDLGLTLKARGIKASNGAVNTSGTASHTDYVKINSGENIFARVASTSSTAGMAFYDESKTYLGCSPAEQKTLFYKSEDLLALGAVYFRCSISAAFVEDKSWFVSKSLNNSIIDEMSSAITQLTTNVAYLISASKRCVYSPDITFSYASSAYTITLDTLVVFEPNKNNRTLYYANGTSDEHESASFVLNSWNMYLVLASDGTIKRRTYYNTVAADDLILLVYNNEVNLLVGGELYGQYIKSGIR